MCAVICKEISNTMRPVDVVLIGSEAVCVAGTGAATQHTLDSGSDESDLLSSDQSESSDAAMASDEAEVSGEEDQVNDVEMATTSGCVLCCCAS